jgi:hypothetical protein
VKLLVVSAGLAVGRVRVLENVCELLGDANFLAFTRGDRQYRDGPCVLNRPGLIDRSAANLLNRCKRSNCRGHDLGRAPATRIVGSLRFEQFGVRKNDPKLVVEPVKEVPQLERFVH